MERSNKSIQVNNDFGQTIPSSLMIDFVGICLHRPSLLHITLPCSAQAVLHLPPTFDLHLLDPDSR